MTQDKTQTTRYEVPAQFAESYGDKDQLAVQRIYEWLNANPKHNKSWLARASTIKEGTLSSILTGKYAASPSEHLKAMLNATMRTDERRELGINETIFVNTATWRLCLAVCNHAFRQRDFGVFAGYVGTGKTTALKQYTKKHTGVYLIEADPDMNANILMTDLLEAMGIASAGLNRSERFRMTVKALKGTESLIIVDEADKIQPKSLEYLRRIRDKAEVGIVLAGTEKLQAMINRRHGQFDQIRSRVSMWPNLIKGISKEDANAVLEQHFPQLISDAPNRLDDADGIKDMFWRFSGGSMRLLAEGLIPAVKTYGLSKHEFSANLVRDVGKQVLGLTATRG